LVYNPETSRVDEMLKVRRVPALLTTKRISSASASSCAWWGGLSDHPGRGCVERPLGLPPLHHELVLFAWRAASWQRVNMADPGAALIHE